MTACGRRGGATVSSQHQLHQLLSEHLAGDDIEEEVDGAEQLVEERGGAPQGDEGGLARLVHRQTPHHRHQLHHAIGHDEQDERDDDGEQHDGDAARASAGLRRVHDASQASQALQDEGREEGEDDGR